MTDTSAATPFDEAARAVRDGADARTEARRLVAAMTTEERLGCLDGDVDIWPGMAEMTAGYHAHPWPAAAVPRLGVPGIAFSDGPRGSVIGPSTAYPVSMARGASFDVELEERIGAAIGAELRANGATFYGGVCVNLLRHPSWGRAQETYGEDPFHVGELGAALCRGAQRHVLACVKHFACNSMENARFKVDVRVDDRALHEVYLPHFRRVVDEGVASVMSAYNRVNGDWCGESTALLTDVLRDEWGFEGFVVSDFAFGLRDPVASVQAGLDIEMPFRQLRARDLPGALADGTLDPADVDAAAERVVATLLRFSPVFDPATDPGVALANPEHRALARESAVKAIVLLQNDADLLPLDPVGTGRIAVVGALAAEANLGDHGSSHVLAPEIVTILDGLRAGTDAEVVHVEDASGVEPTDVAVVVVGRTFRDEGEYTGADATAGLVDLLLLPADADLSVMVEADEGQWDPELAFGAGGDRVDLALSGDDQALVRAVAAVAADTVVVLMGGSAILTTGWSEDVGAIVHAWYPGIEGGHALADLLFGRANPSGHLPFAIPHRTADLVAFDRDAEEFTYGLLHGQWHLDHEGVDAAWPFGWGLSYTTFELRDLAVRVVGDGLRATVTVANTGRRDGDDVVFLFAGLPGSAHLRPARRLIGFARVGVPSGAQERVELAVPVERLAIRVDGRWTVEPGDYVVTAARHAADDERLEQTVAIRGTGTAEGAR